MTLGSSALSACQAVAEPLAAQGPAVAVMQFPVSISHLERPDITTKMWKEGIWLCFQRRVPSALRWSELLSLNLMLSGLEKLTLEANGETALRLEIPSFSERPDDGTLVEELLASIQRASLAALGEPLFFPPESEGRLGELPDVVRICGDAGWPCVRRDEAHWAASLDTPFFSQAEIAAIGSMLQITVDLGAWDSLSPSASEAVCHFLLSAARWVRMARTALTTVGGKERALWMVRLEIPNAEALPHALCALSVGARLTMRELEALRNPAVASAYLATVAFSDAAL